MPANRTARKAVSSRGTVPRASRPYMPGYGIPKNASDLLPWPWAERRLQGSHNYWLVTLRPGGRPHAMPVWGIWHESAFYFSTGRQSRKTRNLRHDPRCLVCTERADEAVIVEGAARLVTDPKLLARLAPAYKAKYAPWSLDPEAGLVYRVKPRVVFGLDEKAFPSGVARWRF